MDGYTFIVLMTVSFLVFIVILVGLAIWDHDNKEYWKRKQ